MEQLKHREKLTHGHDGSDGVKRIGQGICQQKQINRWAPFQDGTSRNLVEVGGVFFGSLQIFLTLTEHEKADRHVGQDPRVGTKLEHVVREYIEKPGSEPAGRKKEKDIGQYSGNTVNLSWDCKIRPCTYRPTR